MQMSEVLAPRRRLVWALIAALILVAGAGVWAWFGSSSSLRSALDAVPASTQRFSFTDWATVRQVVHVSDATAVKPGQNDWIGRGYDRDLTSVSTLSGAADALQQSLGFSPGNLDWEAVDHSSVGNSVVVRPVGGVDFDAIAKKLVAAGYQRPGRADGVWDADTDKLAIRAPGLPIDVAHVALLSDQHLIVTSDDAASAAAGVAAATGRSKALSAAPGVSSTASAVENAAAVMLWAGDFACADLAMSKADDDARAAANQAIQQAGGINPVTGLAMGLTTAGTLTVSELFSSASQADRNLTPRAKLAVGPAIGRSTATFADDMHLVSAKRDGASVLLQMRAARPGIYPLSSLYSGPVIFASC